MFRFEEPAYLYLLLLLPLLAAFYLYSNYRRRKNIRKFGDPELMAQLMPDVSKYRPDVKFWMVFVAIGLFSVLLARPQFGSKLETVKRQGVEVMIALDISNSMLAQDVQPSRLQKAKRLVAQLVDKMEVFVVCIHVSTPLGCILKAENTARFSVFRYTCFACCLYYSR